MFFFSYGLKQVYTNFVITKSPIFENFFFNGFHAYQQCFFDCVAIASSGYLIQRHLNDDVEELMLMKDFSY